MGVKVTGPAGSPHVATVLPSLEEAAAVDTAARERSTRPHLARNPFGKIAAFRTAGCSLSSTPSVTKVWLRLEEA